MVRFRAVAAATYIIQRTSLIYHQFDFRQQVSLRGFTFIDKLPINSNKKMKSRKKVI